MEQLERHRGVAQLVSRYQPFEARIAPERRERGIDPEPAGRKPARVRERFAEVADGTVVPASLDLDFR
ncbi:MAG: hypothetical protein ACREOC_07080 [Gemmatimonadales bacterium]